MNRPGQGGQQSPFQRALEIFRNEGLRSLWFKFLGKTVYRRMDLIEHDLKPISCNVFFPPGLEFCLLTAEDIDEFIVFRNYADRDTVSHRLEQGQRCFLVRDRGTIVHCCWTATTDARIDYLDCYLRMTSDVVYVYESYTTAEYRGRSISSIRSFEMQRYLYAHGYNRLLAVVWPENASAYRSMQKAGYSVVGRVGYLELGRFKRYFCRYEGGKKPPMQIVARRHARQSGFGGAYWGQVPEKLKGNRHYLTPFLARLKRRENLRLLFDWGRPGANNRLLKTDTFEEAVGEDTILSGLRGKFAEIIGMDLSFEITKRAADSHASDGFRFLAADVRKLPFKNAIFSTVASPSTLDHFLEPADLGVSLRELFRVLKPEGRLVITLDNRQNIFDIVLRLVHRLGMLPYFMGRSYTIGELRRELNQAGFVVEETSAILHNPRLVAVGAIRLVSSLQWKPLICFVQKLLLAAQALEHTRLCYYTGSFVAALAIRPSDKARVREQQ